jgi:hypothetical protein
LLRAVRLSEWSTWPGYRAQPDLHLGPSLAVLLLSQGLAGRARVRRQSDWEDFEPPFWRPEAEDAPLPEASQSAPLPTVGGAVGPVVDGSGSLLGCDCPVPPQFNPVCGDDGVTYGNQQKLDCARSCGRSRFQSAATLRLTVGRSLCLSFEPRVGLMTRCWLTV